MKKSLSQKKQELAEKLLDDVIYEMETKLHPFCPICGEELNWEGLKHIYNTDCKFIKYLKLHYKERGEE